MGWSRSAAISTRCGADLAVSTQSIRQHTAPLAGVAWRIVEDQSAIATRPLTDTDDQQALLERLIETAKPPAPDPEREPAFRGLHYLLATPFRYPPLRYGSRFGGRHERGLWYGARRPATALAEKAFYLLANWRQSHAPLQPTQNRFTAFRVGLMTGRGLDLTAEAFQRQQTALASADAYAAAQTTGTRMRAAGVEAFTYRSARDPDGGDAVGVFSPAAFASKTPDFKRFQTWKMTSDQRQVTFEHAVPGRAPRRFTFHAERFEIGGAFPDPVA